MSAGESNREVNEEDNREVHRDENREVNGEINGDINREANREVNREENRLVNTDEAYVEEYDEEYFDACDRITVIHNGGDARTRGCCRTAVVLVLNGFMYLGVLDSSVVGCSSSRSSRSETLDLSDILRSRGSVTVLRELCSPPFTSTKCAISSELDTPPMPPSCHLYIQVVNGDVNGHVNGDVNREDIGEDNRAYIEDDNIEFSDEENIESNEVVNRSPNRVHRLLTRGDRSTTNHYIMISFTLNGIAYEGVLYPVIGPSGHWSI